MDTARANHVEAALRDAVVDQPEVAFLAARCRGVLSNILGDAFTEHRTEIDLVAYAVEEEVPQALTRAEPMEVIAERLAAARDVPVADARWAVRAWAFALAALEDEVPLPAASPRSWPTVSQVDTLEVYADLTGLTAGRYNLPVRYQVSGDIAITGVTPATLDVTIR